MMIRSTVLLAAGRGIRLRPFTDELPKPLRQVNVRATLDYVLTAIARAAIDRVCIVWNFLPHIKPPVRGEIELQSAMDMMIQDGFNLHQKNGNP